jgi:glycosyltransferase involved in cell wall biosynthesis
LEANHWSKPAVLNLAIREAAGQWILCADVDMLWSPGSVTRTVRKLSQHKVALAFQTRDLPSTLTEEILAEPKVAAERSLEFLQHGTLHSRWGNGVLLFRREAALEVGGYDERLTVYGIEDLDFCQRLQRSGNVFAWSDSFRDPLFHVWHPTLSGRERALPWAARSLARNRDILKADSSVVRNVVDGGVGDSPLVSVSIATRDRADLLEDALSSILCQTVQDFEVIIIDDGSTDNTREVVESFNDPRFRYFYQEAAGISAARNKALDVSRGRFTAVMDDDDIMPPWRLERSLASIHAGEHGAVGTFVTFSDVSGEMISWADPFPTLLGASMRGGFAGHPTWMIRTDVMRAFRYDETYTSAVDNNIALRMVRSGVKIRHAGDVFNLRRVHDRQVTATDQQFQGRGAKLNGRWLHAGIPAATIQENNKRAQKTQNSRKPSPAELDAIIPYLPDRLIDRTLTIQTATITATQRIRDTLPVSQSVEATHEGGYLAQLELPGATWRQAADLIRMPDATILNWHATLKTTEQPRKRDEAKGGVVL